VCWVRGNFSGRPGHIFSVCVTPLCGVPGRYNFLGADGGTVQIFPFLWFCCCGYGTVELMKGGGLFFSRFLQFAVSSLSGWMSVVGFFLLCYIFRFSLVDLWSFLAVSYFFKLVIFLNSLQMVQAESELGGPGTSA
jgi:hypothetical protein